MLLGGVDEAVGAARAAVDSLLELSLSKYAEVRMRAIEALGDFQSSQVDSRVIGALSDPDELVRASAVEAFVACRRPMGAGALDRLVDDRSSLVRCSAAIALGDLLRFEAKELIERRLNRARTGDEERVGLVYGLIKLGQRERFPAFLDGLFHDFYRIRCATANLLPDLVAEGDRPFTINLLKSALQRERTIAARSSIEFALDKLISVRTNAKKQGAK